MKLKITKHQEGGMAPAPVAGGEAPQGAPVETGAQQDPMQMIVEGAMQAVQSQDPQIALQVCQMIVEMAGAGAPAEEPVMMKNGGKNKFKKSKKGC